MTKIQTHKTVKDILNTDGSRQRLIEILGKDGAERFIASLMSVMNEDKLLSTAEPLSIINAAMIAATLNLPINKNLGFAYIIPYYSKSGYKAQFQMGYKGFIQLASRTGQVKKINVGFLGKEQFISFDPITETLKYDITKPLNGEPAVYVSYLELINGFTKYVVMTKEQLENHAEEYSKNYKSDKSDTSIWKTNFKAMAQKTVLKKLLSTFAPLDTSMQVHKAIKHDQAVINEDDTLDYVDDPKYKDETPTKVIKNKEDAKVIAPLSELPWQEQEKQTDKHYNSLNTNTQEQK